MDSNEHSEALRTAMADKGMRPEDLAATLGMSKRTIGNWTALTNPKMPDDYIRAQLRRIFPGYDTDGDPVQTALARSGLEPWRQAEVLAVYLRHKAEQRAREDTAG